MLLSGNGPLPTVFVYNFSAALTGESLYDDLTENDHDYHFRGEFELLQQLRARATASPALADVLVVPAMLTQARRTARAPSGRRE